MAVYFSVYGRHLGWKWCHIEPITDKLDKWIVFVLKSCQKLTPRNR